MLLVELQIENLNTKSPQEKHTFDKITGIQISDAEI